MAPRRWRWLLLAMVAALPAGCSDDNGCRSGVRSAFDPQVHPHPTAEAAVEAFMASTLRPDTPVPAEATFEFERTVPATESSFEVAVFREVGGSGELLVQHGRAGGWAVSGYQDDCHDKE